MIRPALVWFSLWMVCALTVSAEQPPWLKDIEQSRPGSFPPLKPCRLEYAFSWSNVVKAGGTEITLGASQSREYPGTLVGQSSGGSKGLARALWPYDHSFTSIIDPKSLRPVVFQSTEVDRKETLWTTNVYGPKGVDVKEVAQAKETGTKKEYTREFPFAGCHDLMSAFLYARSLPLKDGDDIVLLSHPFGSPYVGRFKVLGRETHEIGLGEFKAIKIDVDISKVQGDLQLKHYSKFKKATLWVSDDEYRVPLEVRADIFVGSIRATLTDRRMLNGARAGGAPAAAGASAPSAMPVPAGPESTEKKGGSWFKAKADGMKKSMFRRR